MIIRNVEKIEFENNALEAYKTKLNVFRLNNIYPHEETNENSNITYDVVKNSNLVLGVDFILDDNKVEIKDELFILDGHHRFNFIKDNEIDEDIDVVLIDIRKVSITSYNCQLMVDKDEFTNKIYEDHKFAPKKLQEELTFFISLNRQKYFSKNILNLRDLYKYKKILMQEKMIIPTPNNLKDNSQIIQFTPLSYQDFKKDFVFPYKSTWISPRFDR
ncbi:MAG: hypothetical protein ACJ0GT_02425 [Candidatus Actinomarina sp.]|tara:strand:- start:673 stop:1323 length:651 start_codon:yes stop_codon:yes gene_type:complete